MKIFLISGWAGSGKDTFAQLIMKAYPNKFLKFSFADSLKDYASIKYNINRGLFDTQLGKIQLSNVTINGRLQTMTNRKLLITVANELKTGNKNYFVDGVIKQIITQYNTEKNILIPDFRFKHEYKRFTEVFDEKLYKIITIRINRFKEPLVDDPSEFDLNDFNFDCILNNTSEEFLQSFVENNMEFFL